MIRYHDARSEGPAAATRPAPRGARSAIRSLITLAALVLLGPALVEGAIRVPEDYETLDAAVAAAAAEDSILVGPGTYTPNLTVNVPLTIVSTDGPATTILTGEDQRRPFESVMVGLTLVGFTIESGGDGSAVVGNEFEGGALRVTGTGGIDLLIENCVFRNNRGGRGAAIYVHGTVVIRGSTFEDNSNGAPFPSVSTQGGGVYARAGTDLLIEDCTFRRNRLGTGAAVNALGTTRVRNSTFEDNWANAAGGAINVVLNGDPLETLVEGCTFARNSGSEGGALTLKTTGPKTIRNCDFMDNDGRQNGGAIKASNNGVLLVEDSRFIENTAIEQGGGAIHLNTIAGGITIRRCYFKGNRVDDTLDINAGGGALWMPENATGGGVLVEDCTFVENFAVRGSVALIERTGPAGPGRPLIRRSILAYNVALSSASSLFACGLPGTPSGGTIECAVIYANQPNNTYCVTQGLDVVVLEESRGFALFCDSNYDAICSDSIGHTIGCGPVGGLPDCGKCLTPVRGLSWGGVKSHFRAAEVRPDE